MLFCFEKNDEFREGARAQCLFEDGFYYFCTIVSKEQNGTWTVTWDDSDSRDRIGHPKNHLLSFNKPTVSFFFLIFSYFFF